MNTNPGGFQAAPVPPVTEVGPQAPDVEHPTATDELVAIDSHLAELQTLSSAEQVRVFTDIHQRLTSALSVTGGQPAATEDPQPPPGS